MHTKSTKCLMVSLTIATLLLLYGVCGAYEIKNYRNFNMNLDLSSQGESVAISTYCGVLLWDGESLTELSTDTGMHFSQTCCADVAPDGSVWVGGGPVSRFADGEFLNFEQFSWANWIAAISKDEAWIGAGLVEPSFDHLFHIVGTDIYAIDQDIFPIGLIADRFGNVFCNENSVMQLDKASGKFVECSGFEINTYSFSKDTSGYVYTASDQGLWAFDSSEWVKLEDGSVWTPFPYGPGFFAIDDNETIWASSSSRGLLRRDKTGSVVFTNLCGIDLISDRDDCSTWGNGVTGIVPIGGANIVIATKSDGLLLFDGVGFNHIKFEDGPPEGLAINALEDFSGRIWSIPMSPGQQGVGYLEGDSWHYLRDDEAFGCRGVSSACRDTNGNMHMMGPLVRLVTYDGVEFFAQDGYDHGVTDCTTIQLEPGPDGGIWAGFGSYNSRYFSGVARIRGEDWDVYSTSALFGPGTGEGRTPVLTVAPNDDVWVILGRLVKIFDGEEWTYHDLLPAPIPFTESTLSHAVFDVEGRLVFFTDEGVYRLDNQNWTELWSGRARYGLFDTDGALWFIARDELYNDSIVMLRPDGTIMTMDQTDGLADSRLWCLAIDHNGDKWVGTSGGLSRVQDGGPAQQSIELSTNVNPQGILTFSAQLTNAGRIIPVSLWLACEFGGSLYYYPDWGPAPTPLDLTLSASSIRTEDLAQFDTSTLPPGDYTFYGGISLLGGMDLLIGARGAKIAVATYRRE